jgi:hypothetical protein
MTAPRARSRIVNDPGRHRVEVDVDQQLVKVTLVLDELGAVSALPQRPVYPAPEVHATRHPLLQAPEGTIQGDHTGAHRQVVVIGHQAPGVDGQPVTLHQVAKQADKGFGVPLPVEDALPSAQPVVDVVDPTLDVNSGWSRQL